jgi:hypothetical protein
VLIRVFFHDKCFDGACSAALFSRVYHERIRPSAEFEFRGLLHRAGALFNEADFTGDENAIVDFKYSASPAIKWWFDHHQSAFLTPGDAAHFEQEQSSTKFYDPDFKSCTKLIATVAETRFGFDLEPVRELVQWADTIDGATYDSAATAVGMRSSPPPEAHHGHRGHVRRRQLLPKLIPLLATRCRWQQIVEAPARSKDKVPPLLERHQQVARDPAQAYAEMQATARCSSTSRRIRPRRLQQVRALLPAPRVRSTAWG